MYVLICVCVCVSSLIMCILFCPDSLSVRLITASASVPVTFLFAVQSNQPCVLSHCLLSAADRYRLVALIKRTQKA